MDKRLLFFGKGCGRGCGNELNNVKVFMFFGWVIGGNKVFFFLGVKGDYGFVIDGGKFFKVVEVFKERMEKVEKIKELVKWYMEKVEDGFEDFLEDEDVNDSDILFNMLKNYRNIL